MSGDKKSLRAKLKAQRRTESSARETGDTRKLEETASREAGRFGTLFAFLSMPGEPDTAPFIRAAEKAGKTVLVPRLVPGGGMDFLPFPPDADGLKPNRLGIPEPKDGRIFFSCDAPQPQRESGAAFPFPALVLVPGLAFTADGKRLGRGGGYYDRFLAAFLRRFGDRRGDIRIAGYCFRSQILADIPCEAHDIKMDCLILSDGSMFI